MNKEEISILIKERDLYKKESEFYFNAWKKAIAIIAEKNLENAALKDLINENHLNT